MQLFVRTLGGQLVTVSADERVTVGSIKSRVLEAVKCSLASRHARITYGGRHLEDSARTSACGLRGGETLDMVLPLRGGGGDGGATGAESRDAYLSMYLDKKPDKVDPNEARLARWMQCRLSADALTPPCAMDLLGNLFNKEAIIEALVTKNLPPSLSHIRGLKDLITIHLTESPGAGNGTTVGTSRFHCPISGQGFNGLFKFYALRTCGHVLSARALKEIKGSMCLVCHVPFTETDKIVINGTEEEVESLRVGMEEEKAKAKSKVGKKDKKRDATAGKEESRGGAPNGASVDGLANGRPQPSNGAATSREPNGSQEDGLHAGAKRKPALDKASNGNANVALASSEVPPHRPKGSDRVEPAKRYKAGAHVPLGATKQVYSSIFVSSKKEGLKETYMCRNLPLGRN